MMKFMILSLEKYQSICNRVSNEQILYFFRCAVISQGLWNQPLSTLTCYSGGIIFYVEKDSGTGNSFITRLCQTDNASEITLFKQ